MRRVLAALLMSGLVLSPASSQALVFGPSNLSLGSYPDDRCYQPSPPYGDDRYGRERFRSDTNQYIDCINDYIEAGNNDIERIEEAQRDARSEAELFLSSIRR